ncbi:MAG TPA: acyl-CoA dehydratase activase-related protein [Candidatus Anoxymicrobiaceae bacterium]
MRVGVPRALLYHHYGECWTSFLDAVGIEPVVTEATTSDTVVRGAVLSDNETCLPVKVFAGHLLQLKENTDAVLVPRVVSQYDGMKACPKYLGLPDMARSFDPALPPVMAPLMDLADRRGRWAREWYQLARDTGASAHCADDAVKSLLRGLRGVEAQPQGFGDLTPQAPHHGGGREAAADDSRSFTVGVAGHLYNVYDSRASLGMLGRIGQMGARIRTVDEVSRRDVRRQLKTLPRKIRWDFESRMVGAVLHWSRTRSVAGVIYVSSFACGPGSMIGALIEDQMNREDSVPLMSLILDEHSGEGGLITRIEAFLDMVRRSNEGASVAALRRGVAKR